MKIIKKRNKIFFFSAVVLFALSALNFSPNIAQAQTANASLFLSPASGTYQAGSIFSLVVSVRSEQQAMNAAEAVLKFDPGIIRVTSVSKANSIFIFWPVEPAFSNTAGTVNFTGGTTGQFRGASGRILTINFQAVKEGTASISFTSGRVLAADGMGTDITDRLIGGNYTITPSVAPPVEPPPTVEPTPTQTPAAPKISSPTHPDPEKWYNNNSPRFTWDVPAGVTAARILVGKSATAQPNELREPAVSSHELEDIEDGVWYFSVQLRNQYGWGGIGRFKFQIDTTPPEPFSVEVDNEGDPTNPTPIFRFETTSEPSGIDYYEIILNDELHATVKPEDMKDGFYRSSPLSPGNYPLNVKAVDRAGNSTSAFAQFTVSGIFFEIDRLPSRIKVGEVLEINGRTLPGITIRFYFEKEGEEVIIREIVSDQEGNFQFKELLQQGKYFIWVEAEDDRGALSEPMEKHSLEVVADRLALFLLIILIILIIVGIFIIWFLWKRVSEEKEKTRKEEAKKRVEIKQKAYNVLKEKIKKQIEYLEGKVDLSRSESRVLEDLKKALKASEAAREEEAETENKSAKISE